MAANRSKSAKVDDEIRFKIVNEAFGGSEQLIKYGAVESNRAPRKGAEAGALSGIPGDQTRPPEKVVAARSPTRTAASSRRSIPPPLPAS